MLNKKNLFHIYMISDATGETLLSNARAVAAQYKEKQAVEHVFPMIRSKEQLQVIFKQITKTPGIVLYTILNKELAETINHFCEKINVPYVAVLQPLLSAFQIYLDKPNILKASAQHVLDDNYFKRIAALDFTMAHDDGMCLATIDQAEVILVGISRTSKTPTSIYLANKGIKTANFPLVPQRELPDELKNLTKPLIVGLVATANRISQIRQNRFLGLSFTNDNYVNQLSIAEEIVNARRIFERYNWPILDVTRRSVEETASYVVELLEQHNKTNNNTDNNND